ncbi:hypothetical protein EOA79_17560 [Mesorhizobium sp. M1A.F.Ca.IN.020.03.2.1]|nr:MULTISPECIES: hypothetical protein [unclassified Mesorhizobium]RUV02470.1 hypothetical protein EOA79_17560 [Mesorhizobium sp. M1A.F.Ca.IN.020.03.2.1]RUV20549.1 hypothetical protein EOA91_16060 [Mesorhizobium sp. M1A.F.Ca.IN.022.04.1.1]RWB25731.1 MAG: hypothetical protein EOQ43_32715 [Mesorhizobium sp.]RWE64282.1 MAG: hypothetical protein EOS62_30095 [Mesorhizobium sp.]RWF88735.1 MAG: hypothetical protein EOQ45_31840 [Mesorhizobium sp.]
MAILLLPNTTSRPFSDQTAKGLTAALEIGSHVYVLVAGEKAGTRIDVSPGVFGSPALKPWCTASTG